MLLLIVLYILDGWISSPQKNLKYHNVGKQNKVLNFDTLYFLFSSVKYKYFT